MAGRTDDVCPGGSRLERERNAPVEASPGSLPSGLVQRGINLGNALDALPGSVDALQISDRHLDAIRAAGFDTVRLPVRWSAHTASDPTVHG